MVGHSAGWQAKQVRLRGLVKNNKAGPMDVACIAMHYLDSSAGLSEAATCLEMEVESRAGSASG